MPIDVNNHRNDSQIIVEFKNRSKNFFDRSTFLFSFDFSSSEEDRSKQLILDESPPTGTFSQAHVRLYAAVYLEQYLLSECLSPPIRNKKNFERLTITRVVQPNFELRANNQAYVYCGHDLTKFFNEQNRCPFEFQFVFVDKDVFIDDTNLESLFDDPQLTVNAEFVPDCGVNFRRAQKKNCFSFSSRLCSNSQFRTNQNSINVEFLFVFDTKSREIIVRVRSN